MSVRSRHKPLTLVLAIGTALLLMSALVMASVMAIVLWPEFRDAVKQAVRRSETSAIASTEARVEISSDGCTLYVTNANEFTWVRPWIQLNADFTKDTLDAYQYYYPSEVPPGGEVDVPLDAFTRDGLRFQPRRQAVKGLGVYVQGHRVGFEVFHSLAVRRNS